MRAHQGRPFVLSDPESKIFREAVKIPAVLFIQAFGRHPVNRGQVAVEHDPLAADGTDEPGDVADASNFKKFFDVFAHVDKLRRGLTFARSFLIGSLSWAHGRLTWSSARCGG